MRHGVASNQIPASSAAVGRRVIILLLLLCGVYNRSCTLHLTLVLFIVYSEMPACFITAVVLFCSAFFTFVGHFVGKVKLLEGSTHSETRRLAANVGLTEIILLILSRGVELLTCSSGSEVIFCDLLGEKKHETCGVFSGIR